MRLYHYLPEYNFSEKHKTVIHSSSEKIFEAIHNMDMSKSKVIKTLFLLRGIYGRLNLSKRPENQPGLGFSIKELIKIGFIPLEEIRNQEIIMGLVGKFWQPTFGNVLDLRTNDFMNFNQTGYCKVAWNFYIERNADDTVTLSTETRILCLGRQAKSSFFIYWTVIRPFSGWIRLEMLKLIKEQAEENIS